MSTKHTPGPWEISSNIIGAVRVGAYRGRSIAADGEVVADIAIRPDSQEVIANARLIAAAPEMLEALQTLLFQNRDGVVLERDACTSQARAAISKALGDKR